MDGVLRAKTDLVRWVCKIYAVSQKRVTFWITPWNIGRFWQFVACKITKQLDVNDYSFRHLTLIMSLHYLVKFWSRSLAIYNNEFILNSCVGLEMIKWIATNTSDIYYSSKSHTCDVTSSFSLQPVLKMSSFNTNASGGRWRPSPTARSITAGQGVCWCVISLRWRIRS